VQAGGPAVPPQAPEDPSGSLPGSPTAASTYSPGLEASRASLAGSVGRAAGQGGEADVEEGVLRREDVGAATLTSRQTGALRVLDGPDGWQLMFGGQVCIGVAAAGC